MATLLVDTIGADSHHIPATTPKIGAYLTGPEDTEWNSEELGRFAHAGRVLIDQQPGPTLATEANMLDCEEGAKTVADVIAIGQEHRQLVDHGQLGTYIERSLLDELRQALGEHRLEHMDLWVADWGLTRTQAEQLLRGQIKAVQFASPTSDPHMILPGTDLTLEQANCDLSVTVDAWHAPARSTPSGRANFRGWIDLTNGHWHVEPEPGHVTFGERPATATAQLELETGGPRRGRWHIHAHGWTAKH